MAKKEIETYRQETDPLLEEEYNSLNEEYIDGVEVGHSILTDPYQFPNVTGNNVTKVMSNPMDKRDVATTFPHKLRINWRFTVAIMILITISTCIVIAIVATLSYYDQKKVEKEFQLVVCMNNKECRFVQITMRLSETIQQIKEYVSRKFEVPTDRLNSGGILYQDGGYTNSYNINDNETLGDYFTNSRNIKYFYVYIEDGPDITGKTTQLTDTTISPTTSTSAPDIENNAGFVIGIGLSVIVIVIAFVIYVCQKEINGESNSQSCRISEIKETERTIQSFGAGDTICFQNYEVFVDSEYINPFRVHSYNEKGEEYGYYGQFVSKSYIGDRNNQFNIMSPSINHPEPLYAELCNDIDGLEILSQIYP